MRGIGCVALAEVDVGDLAGYSYRSGEGAEALELVGRLNDDVGVLDDCGLLG